MPSVEQIVSGLRENIGDHKTRFIPVVREGLGVASGTSPETFYTLNMPVISGEDVNLRVGRWLFTKVSSVAAANGLRAYTFSFDNGSYTVPIGATTAISGDAVYGSYTYLGEQEYTYRDSELYEYVHEGTNYVQSMRDLSILVAGVGTGLTLTPTPTEQQAFLIKLAAKYLLSKDREELGLAEAIMIKELDITIDTTRGIGNRIQSSKELNAALIAIIDRLNMGDTAGAGALIDTYSTYVSFDVIGLNYEHNELDGDQGLGVGID